MHFQGASGKVKAAHRYAMSHGLRLSSGSAQIAWAEKEKRAKKKPLLNGDSFLQRNFLSLLQPIAPISALERKFLSLLRQQTARTCKRAVPKPGDSVLRCPPLLGNHLLLY
jgi:hypothetical protein